MAKREGTSQAGTSSKKLKGKTRDKVKVKKAGVENYGIKTPTVPDEDTVDEVPNSQMDSSFVSWPRRVDEQMTDVNPIFTDVDTVKEVPNSQIHSNYVSWPQRIGQGKKGKERSGVTGVQENAINAGDNSIEDATQIDSDHVSLATSEWRTDGRSHPKLSGRLEFPGMAPIRSDK